MARPLSFVLAAALLTLTTHIPVAAQAQAPAATWSQDETVRIVNDVQKKLGGLTTYSVFDWITFGIQGKTLILRGYASRPILKNDAQGAVKRITGVDSVDNQIEVLPPSPNDDRIRGAVYNRIYTAASLRKYNANQGNIRSAIGPGNSVGFAAGGITNTPPSASMPSTSS